MDSPAGGKRLTATGENGRLLRLIAHRGFAAEHAENTLGAVRRASGKADAVEVDARRCGSGEVVVIHDETVNRVSDRSGIVADLSAEKLAELSVAGSDEGVPTLAEVAAAVPEETGLVVELKEAGIAADVLDDTASVDDLVVCSFLPDALVECRDVDPGVPLGLNVVEPTGIRRALDLGCGAVHPHVEACSTGYVQRAHEAGLDVTAWTVENQVTARAMREGDVDGIMADSADVIG